MIAAGIDMGGTKIEAQLFAPDWSVAARRRVDTPADYNGLVSATAALIDWARGTAETTLPVGISAAGLVAPETGLALTANLPATGRPLPVDLARASGQAITWLNDCRAFTLSEARFGAGRGHRVVLGLVIGTGLGGGIAVDGALLPARAGIGGEFGHMTLPAAPVAAHDLPLVDCGCGRRGCVETLLSGPGLSRLYRHLSGSARPAPDIAAARGTDAMAGQAWSIWMALLAETLWTLVTAIDPDIVVLGGGVSRTEGLAQAATDALRARSLPGFGIPAITIAEGGDASGARGAALAAWQEAGHG